jgi:glycosyltransferase involved in cell wall biosynthesis
MLNNMSVNPLVSIIVTSYNVGSYLMEAVSSVLAQTYKKIELIIVDDGSDDVETIKALKLCKEKKICVIIIENSGVSSARNIGVAHSRGEYIVFLDGDDIIKPTYIEQLIKTKNEHPDAELVYTITRLFGKKNYLRPMGTPKFSRLLIYNDYFAVTCLLSKSRFVEVGEFNEKMIDGIEDWEMFIRYCYPGMKVCRINQPLFLYRIKKVSRTTIVSASVKKTLLMRLEILRNNIDVYSRYPESLKKHCLVVERKRSIKRTIKKLYFMLVLYIRVYIKIPKVDVFFM